ncbi:solute carrier family 22 member 21 [Plakobranchus ocellatus]|uniref:Solute carrier family 22 member 21 n=1 Tax=Plakobranchus ocellatus TaxID=259542 RepID=A0AAV3ZNX9_9GAST|nr:solute carrier family 22 member 21 [Plakobranchus ocellatus]
MGLEELLAEAGGMGRFQVIILSIAFIGRTFCGWSMFQMTFAGIVPDFHCETQGGPDYDRLPSNVTLNSCSVPHNTSDQAPGHLDCITYNFTGPYKTVMKDFALVCDQSWIKGAVTSIQMAGLMVGCISAGQLGDAVGRWKTNLLFVIILSLSNISAAFSPDWEVFAACRFFIGLGIGGILVSSFTLVLEFFPTKWRPLTSVVPSWTIGVSLFALFSYLLQDWRKLHLLCGACGLIQVPLLFFVPESLRWLAVKGHIERAEATVDKMARWNGRPCVSRAKETLQMVYEEEKKAREKSQRYTYLDIIRPWSTAKITLIMCYHWFSYSLAYYGISFGISDLAGNFFVNVFLMGVLEVPFRMATFYTNNKVGRKLSAFPFVVLALGCSVGCMILEITVGNSQTITVLSLVAQTGISVAWCVIQTWGNELYPTVIRKLSYGASNTAARISGILAPILINFEDRMLMSYSIMAGFLAVDAVLILLLPETKGQELPDRINEIDSTHAVESEAQRIKSPHYSAKKKSGQNNYGSSLTIEDPDFGGKQGFREKVAYVNHSVNLSDEQDHKSTQANGDTSSPNNQEEHSINVRL